MHQREMNRANAAFQSGVEALVESATPADRLREELQQLLFELHTAQRVAARLSLLPELAT